MGMAAPATRIVPGECYFRLLQVRNGGHVPVLLGLPGLDLVGSSEFLEWRFGLRLAAPFPV